MLTLESGRFQELGEVSFCTRILVIAKETEQGVTITLYNGSFRPTFKYDDSHLAPFRRFIRTPVECV